MLAIANAAFSARYTALAGAAASFYFRIFDESLAIFVCMCAYLCVVHSTAHFIFKFSVFDVYFRFLLLLLLHAHTHISYLPSALIMSFSSLFY